MTASCKWLSSCMCLCAVDDQSWRQECSSLVKLCSDSSSANKMLQEGVTSWVAQNDHSVLNNPLKINQLQQDAKSKDVEYRALANQRALASCVQLQLDPAQRSQQLASIASMGCIDGGNLDRGQERQRRADHINSMQSLILTSKLELAADHVLRDLSLVCVLPSCTRRQRVWLVDSHMLPVLSPWPTMLTQADAKLLYRGSKDGFKHDNWQAKCLMQSPTLTLVKVHRLMQFAAQQQQQQQQQCIARISLLLAMANDATVCICRPRAPTTCSVSTQLSVGLYQNTECSQWPRTHPLVRFSSRSAMRSSDHCASDSSSPFGVSAHVRTSALWSALRSSPAATQWTMPTCILWTRARRPTNPTAT